MMKKKIVISFALAILVVLYIFFAIRHARVVGNRLFIQFNSSNLNDEIENVQIVDKGVGITLKNNNEEFVFFPITGPLNNYQIFNHIAEKGDTVFKPAYSDTLKLIKHDSILLYTFTKPNKKLVPD